jgi:hypothetical protein
VELFSAPGSERRHKSCETMLTAVPSCAVYAPFNPPLCTQPSPVCVCGKLTVSCQEEMTRVLRTQANASITARETEIRVSRCLRSVSRRRLCEEANPHTMRSCENSLCFVRARLYARNGQTRPVVFQLLILSNVFYTHHGHETLCTQSAVFITALDLQRGHVVPRTKLHTLSLPVPVTITPQLSAAAA